MSIGRGIAYEGCSCRAAFQVGVAQWFRDHGVGFDVVGGASSGSLVAAAHRLERLDELEVRWTQMLGQTRVFEPFRLLRGRWPGRMSHILGEALHDYLGDVGLSEVPEPLVIVVTQLRRRGLVRRALTQRDAVSVSRAIRASSFIPGPYSRMVPIGGRPTFDGAWQARAPVDEVRAEGADRVLCVVTKDRPEHRGGMLGRTVLPIAQDTRVLSPVQPLPISGFDFDGPRTRATFEIGRRSAERFARAHEDWLG